MQGSIYDIYVSIEDNRSVILYILNKRIYGKEFLNVAPNNYLRSKRVWSEVIEEYTQLMNEF